MQPIVSTCMAMTKSDVRKYTRDLITLSYVRKAAIATSSLKQPGTDDDNDNDNDEEEEESRTIFFHNVAE